MEWEVEIEIEDEVGGTGGKTEPLTRCKAASHRSAGVSPRASSLLLVRTRQGSSCRYLHALDEDLYAYAYVEPFMHQMIPKAKIIANRGRSLNVRAGVQTPVHHHARIIHLGIFDHEVNTCLVAFPSIMSSEITV